MYYVKWLNKKYGERDYFTGYTTDTRWSNDISKAKLYFTKKEAEDEMYRDGWSFSLIEILYIHPLNIK